jgi:ABC-type transporter Mla subunit MlaD
MLAEAIHSLTLETQIFIGIILLFNFYFHIRFTPETALKSPAFLTTLGILGTFIGIAIGLWHFDANDVQGSVPKLIDGIKTAVWASAFGIFCALTIKLRDIIAHRRRTPAVAAKGATADDIAEILRSIDAEIADLKPALDSYHDRMAEANTKALVTALSGIIADFNVKLNEQFGENFKKLNEASERLVAWQQAHGEQLTQTTSSMKEASEHFAKMTSQSGDFHKHAEGLAALLAGLEVQRKELTGSLTSLSTLVNNASSNLPQLEERLNDMTVGLARGMQAANETFNQNMAELISKTKEQVMVLDTALSEELTKSLESFGRQMAALSQKFADDYGPITERLNAILKIGK